MNRRIACLLWLAAACADSSIGGDDASPRDANADDARTSADTSVPSDASVPAEDASEPEDGSVPQDASMPTDASMGGPLSDEFVGSTLSPSWTVWHPSEHAYSVSGGALHIVPNQQCVWWHGDTGPALLKSVTGDFKATTVVHVRSASMPTMPPPPIYQFGGLVARSPAGAPENWVFAVLGERNGYVALETKTTVDGVSDIIAPEWTSVDAEIRICRFGSSFRLLARAPGASTWTAVANHTRTDMPGTLQVGPIAYTYTTQPDLRASFDRITIEAISSLAHCTTD